MSQNLGVDRLRDESDDWLAEADIPHVGQEILIDSVVGQVDWLTITSKNIDQQERLLFEANRLTQDLVDAGWVRKPWGWRGYKGWICAGLRWGTRPGEDILMLSGAEAAINWPPALAMATNVTRVDLAATVSLADPLLDVAKRAYSLIVTDPNKCETAKRKYSYVENSWGGQTMYVGSRASEQFGRLYDKGCENENEGCIPPGLIWRYETEYKGYGAKRMAKLLLERAKLDTVPIGDEIRICVYNWFFGRGVKPIWHQGEDRGIDWTIEFEARITDDNASLLWLTNQVKPTVKRLVSRDRADEVLEALGITVVRPAGWPKENGGQQTLDKNTNQE